MNAEVLSAFIRHALTTFGGVLVTRGYLDMGMLEAGAGAVAVLVGIAWSVYAKRKPA